MIVRDEEKHLRGCLESAKDFVDEIIIADTGSKDRTLEIAKEFTDKIFEFEWTDDFSAARNFSLSKASCDWILVLDADERISKEDLMKLKKLVLENNEKEENILGYYLIQRNYTNNSESIGWVSSQGNSYSESKIALGYVKNPIIRLFKNNKGIKFEGKVHETLEQSISAIGKAEKTEIVIHHFGILNREEKGKAERNIAILKKELEESEEKAGKSRDLAFNYFQLAVSFLSKKDIENGKANLLKSLELDKNYIPALVSLSGIFINENNLDEAEKLLIRASSLGQNADVYNNLGVIYSKREEINRAIKKFKRAIELNPNSADAYFNIGLLYSKIKKDNKAKEYFEKAVQLNPGYSKA